MTRAARERVQQSLADFQERQKVRAEARTQIQGEYNSSEFLKGTQGKRRYRQVEALPLYPRTMHTYTRTKEVL
jgi:hypothetical protein